jgi:hypothetical protein
MLVKISLVVALCSGVHFNQVQKRLAEIQSANPGAKVSVRIDKKAACANGQVLTGADAKLLDQLGK